MITIGDAGEATIVVTEADSAAALAIAPDDSFPEVYATSRMIGLMEVAAARVMRPSLEAGQLSVGVSLNVRHVAATPIGGRVRAIATYLGPEGKFYRFRVEAFDDGGLIGDGDHTRAIVSSERLVAGAAKRMAAATGPRTSAGA